MVANKPDAVMTIPEVARYLKVSESTVYRLVRQGKLPARKVGGGWRFHRRRIEDWLQKTAADDRLID